ncbi:HTH domain-containing protein [Winogradskyella forsetii]|uniref:HTH domain-containing protein n=1 Tax=Winogradskyella forsetii TaxID=2686077 RepID=UPI0015BB71AD|nr:HTH domain-containing protein [Winogradskyella forsetii]
MTIREAILKTLEAEKRTLTYLEVYNLIEQRKYYTWENARTPADTIAAQLGRFIRKNDKRVKRIKGKKGFEYYLAKYENELNLSEVIAKVVEPKRTTKSKTYQERDLHILLSSYLNTNNTYSKTIYHEHSRNSKDNHQKWIHPDMIGINFLNLKNKSSQALMKVINKADAFDITSYEIKREIKSDYELKKCFFQAVSNSSWANYGYLVAFEISSNLRDEMERLNQSFGIGIIELQPNPYESEVLFPSRYRELDFQTIDKLCVINKSFEKFITQTETLLIATDRYIKASKKEFVEFCDNYLETDTEIEKYCLEKNIPAEKTV